MFGLRFDATFVLVIHALSTTSQAIDYMDMFDYDDSKYKFLTQLLQKKYDSNQGKIHLTEQEKKAVQSLRFYYDIQSILNSIDPDIVTR